MTFINKAQKTLSAFRPLLPQLPLRSISSSLPTRAPMEGPKGPSFKNLTGRQSKIQVPTTVLRSYADEPKHQKPSSSASFEKVLLTSPFMAATQTKAESREKMTRIISNFAEALKDAIKETYPDITITEIKKTLSMDYFGDDLEAFAKHILDFFVSVDSSNAAFPDREPVTVAKAFTDYKKARERIMNTSKDGVIYLAFFDLTLCPPEIKNQAHAKDLILFYTRLTALPESIGELRHINTIEIRGNYFPTFPECLTKLTMLGHLIYTNNRTETLPDTFCNLTRLEKLNLEKNQISALPANFGKLSRLEQIDLEHNHLRTLPDSFGALTNLKECFLKDNHLESLPETFGGLENLTLLQLSDNKLTVLPSLFGRLPALEELYIERNQLTEFPSIMSGMQKLAILTLNHNKLKSLPPILGTLPKLSQLSVANNELTEFPKFIAGSLSIRGLDLGGNQLTKFNHVMPQLQVLLLTKNKLTKCPPIEDMPNLRYLSIVKNPIQSLPDNLTGLDQRSHCLNDRMAIGWAGAILDVLKIPNRPTPKITVFEDTEINGRPFYFIIEENHPLFQDPPVSKL